MFDILKVVFQCIFDEFNQNKMILKDLLCFYVIFKSVF
jgi:hypothetical protein